MKAIKFIIPMLLVLILLVACGTKEKSPYVGTWKMDAGSDNVVLVINDDKTFDISDSKGSLNGSYSINDDIISFKVEEIKDENPVNDSVQVGDTLDCQIKSENDILTLKYENESFSFTKQ